MSFDTYFRASSYAMIVVAMLALVLAGGLSFPLAIVFAVVIVAAWKLEGTKWQISERVALVIVLLSIPLFFLDWQYQSDVGEPRDRMGVNALAHLILFLSTIKLLQVKSDRDWVFLYLISFFEMLLAAGLSFSPAFLGTLTLYLFCGLSTVIAFEIRKARRAIEPVETRLLVSPDAKVFRRLARGQRAGGNESKRLPALAAVLFILIFVLALPLFLIAPRAGSATISVGGSRLNSFIGFSESVTLGEIGTLKSNNEVVMRVRLEDSTGRIPKGLRWRGVALDEFTGRGWRKSAEARRSNPDASGERGFFKVGSTASLEHLTTHTIILEPIESNILFALPQPVAIQGDFPSLRVDAEGSIQSRRSQFDRIIYKALSDTTEPPPEILREDFQRYQATQARYLRLPSTLDERIFRQAAFIVESSGARTRYDIASAIEADLQNRYGYTLDMKASGPDPLADFLFNVREGHCEYFSTAMAVMLRTQGIAARVVNGFLPGEYNDAAGAYTVRQSDAHSWVEVYFPESNSWVTFDPTPSAGRTVPVRAGVAAQLGKYAEALELLWFQYVIGYDKQEQRSLATTAQTQVARYHRLVSDIFDELKISSWTALILGFSVAVILACAAVLLWRVKRFGWQAFRLTRRDEGPRHSEVEFYEALVKLLAERGIHRSPEQTPLEFATSLKMQDAVIITAAYNRVRYGAHRLSQTEQRRIEEILGRLKESHGNL
jgi:transglutaminase-like putative cysteine protease